MKTVTVSESALDSIKRMGEADAVRIVKLEVALREIRHLFTHQDWHLCRAVDKLIDEALK